MVTFLFVYVIIDYLLKEKTTLSDNLIQFLELGLLNISTFKFNYL